ncbi:MAG: class I SAM-dependent methyltransferase [Desmonostoc vinosum HA7617-LM4]|jgi:SAM-dependent methyltransferase|nr:class I SAM-dependent methyltransferase [Desmonostoc vinosum HA7617-LM4]
MYNQEEYKLQTQAFYLDRASRSNDNSFDKIAKRVGWESCTLQYIGFEVATTYHEINWQNIKSVLDIGCGYGTLVQHLRENKNFQGNYTGIDILPNFIEEAKKLYGSDERNNFIEGDFLADDWSNKYYDIVISLGILGVNYDQPNQYGEKSKYCAKRAIALMMKLAKLAISIYFLNEDNFPILQRLTNFDMAFYQPEEIQQIIKEVSDKKYNLTIESFPEANDAKTIAKLCFV